MNIELFEWFVLALAYIAMFTHDKIGKIQILKSALSSYPLTHS